MGWARAANRSVTSAEEPDRGGNASVNAGEVAIRKKRRAPADIWQCPAARGLRCTFHVYIFNPLQFLLAQKLIGGLHSTPKGGSFITRVLRGET
jgi:hypothetical protein